MKLYDYQIRVAQLIRAGKSVILQAPTGAGKTIAALWPYLEAWDRNSPSEFPRKCIYSVPMRVLANQFNEEVHKLVNEEMLFAEPPAVKIQTGEHSEDPKFCGDLIFATIDQSLSSALAVPYSLSSGMANINAGAFYSSYLVFDEFHLFPLDDADSAGGALTTTLQLLMELKGIIPFVLMTATFSSTMLTELKDLLGAEIVQVSPDEYKEIASRGADRPRSRQYLVYQEPITAQSVLAKHNRRSVVICNQVKRAQDLYSEIKATFEDAGDEDADIEVCLLHSRFMAEHRQEKEILVRREFSKNKAEHSVTSMILIATQVIEVGLDITCENLHTEIAPANSVFQRAGRCARYPGEQGIIHIYDVPKREFANGITKPNYLPYSAEICASAWESFLARHGQVLGFIDEQAVIDEVHTESDRQVLDAMARRSGRLWDDIYAAMQEGAKEQRSNLIRRVDNITVLAGPDEESIGDPYRAKGFGLWRGTVKGMLKTIQESAIGWFPDEDDENWLMKMPVDESGDPDDPTQAASVAWYEVIDSSQLDGAAIVLINSAFCKYDCEIGFRIVLSGQGGWSSTPGELKKRNSQGGFAYNLESYSDHIGNMLKVYRRDFGGDYQYVQQRIAQQWNLPPDCLTKAIETAVVLHDLAKMDKRWQRWVRLYQKGIDEPITEDAYMAVHTHWLPMEPTHQQAKKAADRQCKRPPHAGESAVAGARIIAQICGDDRLTRAVITAITRHHSAKSHTFEEYELHPSAKAAIDSALALTDLQTDANLLISKAPSIRLDKWMIKAGNFEEILLYLWIVRILRLSDQLSLE